MQSRFSIWLLLRLIRRLLPRSIRRQIKENYYRLAAPLPTVSSTEGSGTPVVVGLMRTASGIGQSARLCLSALRDLGLAAHAFDLSEAFGQLHLREENFGTTAAPADQGPVIVHINPPELRAALAALGRNRIRNRLIIGYWAWELPVMPSEWEPLLRYVHEVWVPSNFCAQAIQPRTNKPVRVVPCPVRSVPDSGERRSYFGLPADAFVVLALADARSSLARKNPIGAIKAFQRAFGSDDRFVLCIKVMGSDSNPDVLYTLQQAIARTPNIMLMQGPLSGPKIGALIRCADAVLSLHRAEGFGLVLAEAMLLAKPVIATGWSGNCDFMTAENAALVPYRLVPVTDPQRIYPASDQQWAEPDLDVAADWLRRLADDIDLRTRIGQAGSQSIATQLSLDRYAAALSPRFWRACGQERFGGTAQVARR